MSEVTKPIALDESFNTTGQTPKNIADVIKNGLQEVAQAIDSHQGGGGHVILDQNGNALDQEPNMQFVDAHTSDDSVNTKTIIENIKSVTQADYPSETEDGLYLIPDGEGSVIEPASEDYVEVTADGVKTYGTLLNELYTQIDFNKITPNSHLRGLQDIFFLRRITNNLLIFSGFRISATNGYYESINLESNNSTMYLSTYTKSSGNWTIDNETNSIVSSGTKLTLYYGNKKAVVDLQTTANRCLLTGGGTVQDALETESNHFTFQTSGYVQYHRIGMMVMLHIVKNAVPTNEVIGTLPVGFRPSETLRFRNYAGNGFAIVSSDGSVTLSDYESWCNTTCTYLTL